MTACPARKPYLCRSTPGCPNRTTDHGVPCDDCRPVVRGRWQRWLAEERGRLLPHVRR